MYKIIHLVNGAFFRDEKGHAFFFTNEEINNKANLHLQKAQQLEPEVSKVILMGVAELHMQNAEDLVGGKNEAAGTVSGKGGLTPAQKAANTKAAKKGLPLPYPEETK